MERYFLAGDQDWKPEYSRSPRVLCLLCILGQHLHELEADVRQVQGLISVPRINDSLHGASMLSRCSRFVQVRASKMSRGRCWESLLLQMENRRQHRFRSASRAAPPRRMTHVPDLKLVWLCRASRNTKHTKSRHDPPITPPEKPHCRSCLYDNAHLRQHPTLPVHSLDLPPFTCLDGLAIAAQWLAVTRQVYESTPAAAG